MSGDETAATQILAFSNEDKTIDNKSPHYPEQWDIELMGEFLFDLYHRSLLPTKDWYVKKTLIHEQYLEFFTDEQMQKIKEAYGTNDIGIPLYRCGYLRHAPSKNPFYIINFSKLFEYRNKKLKEIDDMKLEYVRSEMEKNVANSTTVKSNVNKIKAKTFFVYQGTSVQARIEDDYSAYIRCYLCQEDFSNIQDYKSHIQIHSDDTDFGLSTSLITRDKPMFSISYTLSDDSPTISFEFKTSLENVIIEKILILRPYSLQFVNNKLMPYKCSKNGKDNINVDTHLIALIMNHPMVLIFHEEANKDIRILELHQFVFPKNFLGDNVSVEPVELYLPNKKLFKNKLPLHEHFPSKDIRDALKDDFYYENLMKVNNEFCQYILNGKNFEFHNMGNSLNTLLQVEDIDVMQEYIKLTQTNMFLGKQGAEYVLQLTVKERLLCAYDEIVLTTRSGIYNNEEDLMQLVMQNSKDIKRMNDTFVGIIQAVNAGRIIFKCEKNLKEQLSYTVIFRPARLNIRYQYRALESLSSKNDYLKKFLFPSDVTPRPLSTMSLSLYNSNINGEQLQAVRNIAEGPRNDATYIIFGPPGTGKTTTIVEAILQVLKRPDTKILVTASSNTACDEIALRLCKYLDRINRVMIRIYSRTYKSRIETIDDELLNVSNIHNDHFYPDVNVLHEYRIVVCTLSVVGKLVMGKFGHQADGSTLYTHVFVDEVAASTEPEALMAITNVLMSDSCLIISGDHKQLGPVLQSKRAELLGLDKSLMDRLMELDCYRVDANTGDYDRTIQTHLVRNYRSHPAIVNLYSGLYYNHSLEAHANKDDVSLCEIWHKSRNKQYPIMFHSVMGSSKTDNNSLSLYNINELKVVMDYVKDFMYFGINGVSLKESDIGIISPYKSQYKRIQEELNLRNWFGIETGSVETFQGKEKAIIIVSFVRSNTGTLGFLDSPRRLNVTISRAKSLLIMIGNPKTLSRNSDLQHIIEECKRNNTLIGACADFKPARQNPDYKENCLATLNTGMQDLSIENEDQGNNTPKINKSNSISKTSINEEYDDNKSADNEEGKTKNEFWQPAANYRTIVPITTMPTEQETIRYMNLEGFKIQQQQHYFNQRLEQQQYYQTLYQQQKLQQFHYVYNLNNPYMNHNMPAQTIKINNFNLYSVQHDHHHSNVKNSKWPTNIENIESTTQANLK